MEVPSADGVPVIAPVALSRFSPIGSVPADTDHVRGSVPPLATTVFEYRVVAVPPGNDVVVNVNVEAIGMVNACVTVACAASTT